jgi:outer membrane protein assembly factor BamB
MQIGFVGLGKMGGNMVHRIHRDSDNQVVAFDIAGRKVKWRYEHPDRKFPFYSSAAVIDGTVVLGGRDRFAARHPERAPHGEQVLAGRCLVGAHREGVVVDPVQVDSAGHGLTEDVGVLLVLDGQGQAFGRLLEHGEAHG